MCLVELEAWTPVPHEHEHWHAPPLTQRSPSAVLCIHLQWGTHLNCADKEDCHTLNSSHMSADCPAGPSPYHHLAVSLTDGMQVDVLGNNLLDKELQNQTATGLSDRREQTGVFISVVAESQWSAQQWTYCGGGNTFLFTFPLVW